jgi:hypothetical protein
MRHRSMRTIHPLLATLFAILLAVVSPPGRAKTVDLPTTCSTSFLGDNPVEGSMGWTDANNGIAHDAGNWFFTSEEELVKIPVGLDLNTDIDPDDDPSDWPPGVLARGDLPDSLADAGWHHQGDLDQANGFLFIPMNRDEGYPTVSGIAVYRASDLAYKGIAELPPPRLGWVAINPHNGLLYTSGWEISAADGLLRYHIDYDAIAAGNVQAAISFVDEFDLTGVDPPLKDTQGGAFTPWGELYIVNGVEGETPEDERGGVHLFNAAGELIAESQNAGGGGFSFVYDPAPDEREEPEGADWWNRNIDPTSPGIGGQLHVMLNDNDDVPTPADPFPSDDLSLKHYEVALCNPAADFDSDGLTDGDESFILGTDPVGADTDGDGVNDGDELHILKTDPLDRDSDDDGVTDGQEDPDGDGLPNTAEFGSWHTDPFDADSDDDLLTDGDEVHVYHTDPAKWDTDGDTLGDGAEVHTHGTDPLKADSDDDGLTDPIELASGTDPIDKDTDDDGLPDGSDVEFVLNALQSLPLSVFTPPGAGTKQAIESMLDAAEGKAAAGDIGAALLKLRQLRSHLDGCGTRADSNDWIVVCAPQVQVRELLDLLISNLSS